MTHKKPEQQGQEIHAWQLWQHQVYGCTWTRCDGYPSLAWHLLLVCQESNNQDSIQTCRSVWMQASSISCTSRATPPQRSHVAPSDNLSSMMQLSTHSCGAAVGAGETPVRAINLLLKELLQGLHCRHQPTLLHRLLSIQLPVSCQTPRHPAQSTGIYISDRPALA